MMRIAVNIQKDLPIAKEIRYVLSILGNNQSIRFIEAENGIQIGTSDSSSLRLSQKFISNYTNKIYSSTENLNNKGYVELESGEPDYLSTAFYMLACLQEYDSALPLDSLGRFQYSHSYQFKLNLTKENIVQHCFNRLTEKLKLSPQTSKTRFYLSHDIDSVYGSVIQDGFYAIKKGRFDIFLQLLYRVAIQKPDWLNIDAIMDLESEYDCKSIFFWLVRNGKSEGLKNSDYNFNSKQIQKLYHSVHQRGFDNGIHKSISKDSFKTELSEFDKPMLSNRYHYLKFNLPQGYNLIQEAELKIDASLGFAESIGFRNNYGLPYTPFNVSERNAYSFIEVPLHVMDATLFKYQKQNPNAALNEIINFFESNKENCLISVLWHNNFFTNYKYAGYLNLYKNILAYIRDNNFKTITQEEIIKNYSITWP